MSIFLPYNVSDVISYLTDLFSIDLSSLTAYEYTSLTILCNLYFYLFWFFIIYFSLLIFNRIWERFL